MNVYRVCLQAANRITQADFFPLSSACPPPQTGALVEQTSQFVEVLGLRAERLETELQQTQLLMLAMQVTLLRGSLDS